MNGTIRIGTRGSALALWQAQHVAELLKASGFQTEIIPIETRGDRIADVTIAKIGSKGVFTEEIEAQVRSGEVDIAVHSAKDLSSEMPDELELIAFSEREPPNDVLVSLRPVDLTKPVTIGTSSTRRTAFTHHFYPAAEVVTVRGNVPTRIEKLKQGACDALVLAYAGIHRLGITGILVERIDTSYFVPPVGQGTIAVQCHRKMPFEKKEALRKFVNHEPTELCLIAERSFLKTLHGGCSIPVFGYAQLEGDLLTVKGGIISLEGDRIVKIKQSGPKESGKDLGKRLADEVLASGGREILEEIRKTIPHK